jgi:LmbE family N-acetylglucosaminyl deacetylase
MVSGVDVMVIIAHPDDAEFGAAGTIAKWTAEGKNVLYLLCTSGEKGTADMSVRPEELAKTREKEQWEAARVLGVREVVFMRYPDQGLEDTFQFRKAIVKEIRRYRPHTVITSDPYRRYIWHRDHRIVGQVVLDAVYPYARDHLAYLDLIEEGLQPHKVKELLFWGAENANYRVDITATFQQKFSALLCHESQVREMTIPDLEGWLKDRAREMAAGEDYELGETFHRVEVPL